MATAHETIFQEGIYKPTLQIKKPKDLIHVTNLKWMEMSYASSSSKIIFSSGWFFNHRYRLDTQ